MFDLKPGARHVLLACSSIASVAMLIGPATVQAQQTADQIKERERVTITGSNIRRTDTETVAPVEIITREAIERTGKATVADVLRSIPSNTGGSFGESFSNSFAPGAAGISLRGLGQKTTLVLINGRRMAGYGFAQNLQDIFVDLNAIPSSAVERIEVLKDGASAIYGSDAIAGVVNIILRRDFKGIEVTSDIGFFEGKQDYRVTLAGGFGDLGTNRFNLFGTLDLYKRDELLMSDTKFGESRDMRDYNGGRNFQSLTAGGVWQNVTGFAANGRPIVGNERRAISDCSRHGRVVGFAEALQLGFAIAAAQQLPQNTWCLVDVNKVLSALPGAERIGFIGKGTFDVTPRTQLYGEVGLSQNKTEQTFTPPFFANTVGLQQTAVGLRPFTYNAVFNPGVAGNPLATQARFTGNLYGLGTRDLDITSDTWRGLVGAKYGFGTWDFDSGIGASRNEIEQININRITLAGTSAALGIPTTPQPPEPVSNAAPCNLDQQYSSAGCRGMLINFPRKSTSELMFVDTKANTEFGELPGGPIGVALGLEFREEKINDSPDPNAQAGNILGQGITATDGKRNNTAAFVEFSLPLTRTIEMQLAARHDKYSDFGNATTPKVGMKFRPTNEVLLRANWGRGFRAPTLPEIAPSTATFFTQVNDGLTGQAGINISGVFAGNPNLRPEKSRSTTLGVVLEPSADFSVSLDYYEINWADIVFGDCCQAIVNADVNSRLAGGPGDPRVIRDPGTLVNGQPTIVTVVSNFINLSRVETKGFDVDMRHSVRTGVGRITSRLNGSYVGKYVEDGTERAGKNGNGTNTIPRFRATASVGVERGAWLVQGAANYIHHYDQELLDASFQNPNQFGQNGVYGEKVPAYTTYDLFGRYSITRNLQVSASILNIFDETPPYDPGFSATFLYDFSMYDVRGRIYRIGVKYKF